MGGLLQNYYAVGHDSLDNYVAQISGQAPDHATQNDCGVWTKFRPANMIEKPFGQLVGDGCVYPASIPTLGNQLSAAHLTWKAYLQDMGNQPARDHTTMTKQGPAYGHRWWASRTTPRAPPPPTSTPPLLDAAHDRGHLRPVAPWRRGHAAGQAVRRRRIHEVLTPAGPHNGPAPPPGRRPRATVGKLGSLDVHPPV
jgi:hypothetical protein